MKRVLWISAIFLASQFFFAQFSVPQETAEPLNLQRMGGAASSKDEAAGAVGAPDAGEAKQAAQSTPDEDATAGEGEIKAKAKVKYTKQKSVPPDRKPQKRDTTEAVDRSEEYASNCADVFKYGLETQIASLIDELTANGDWRFSDNIYALFYETKSTSVKERVLDYFGKAEDPCLASFAVEVINDPYDVKKSLVERCFKYVKDAKVVEACPGLVDLVDKEDDAYFTGALSALGEIGGKEEALFLAGYLERDDLSVANRQALMRVLGRIQAVETWDKVAAIAQDDAENTFVRMYAAEALGAMGKAEGEAILIELFESDDPNLRAYVVKGISHFKGSKADDVIIQALRDSQWKVRLEAASAVEERGLKAAAPYLVFRCKDKDEQKSVKEKCYKVLAKLDTAEGREYLTGLLKDKKTADATKARVASCLLEAGSAGTDEVIELARESLKSDARKSLRYALGKEFAKYGRPEFADICAEYIAHADTATQGTGLDIWAKGRYSSVKAAVEEIARDAQEDEGGTQADQGATSRFTVKKKNVNAKKAKSILERS